MALGAIINELAKMPALKRKGGFHMRYLQITIVAIICIFIAGLSCSSDPKPDHYGVFVVSKGRLVELQRIPWEKLGKAYGKYQNTDLVTDLLIFIFNERNIADIDNSNVYFITYGMSEEPIILPASKRGEKYEVTYPTPAGLTFGIKRYIAIEEFEIMPIEGKQEMFRIKPKTQLTPGVYLFSTVGCKDNPRDFRCFFPLRVH